jgi:hypothetical protein
MSFSKPSEPNILLGVKQRGHAHKPISLMVAIKTLKISHEYSESFNSGKGRCTSLDNQLNM